LGFEECEASWASQNVISKNSFQDYGTAMESKGLNPLWSELSQKGQKGDRFIFSDW